MTIYESYCSNYGGLWYLYGKVHLSSLFSVSRSTEYIFECNVSLWTVSRLFLSSIYFQLSPWDYRCGLTHGTAEPLFSKKQTTRTVSYEL